jgi:hypothetical protein
VQTMARQAGYVTASASCAAPDALKALPHLPCEQQLNL